MNQHLEYGLLTTSNITTLFLGRPQKSTNTITFDIFFSLTITLEIVIYISGSSVSLIILPATQNSYLHFRQVACAQSPNERRTITLRTWGVFHHNKSYDLAHAQSTDRGNPETVGRVTILGANDNVQGQALISRAMQWCPGPNIIVLEQTMMSEDMP